MQELLIKGFQRENEKLTQKNKNLSKENSYLKENLYDKDRDLKNF